MLKVIEDAALANDGLVELARKLGISHQSFYSWTRVPAERVIKFEELSGIPREKLRPDIYPAAPRRRRAA
jgi:DNA-binding transcriptional regulator YdaS (Cro superfamily)